MKQILKTRLLLLLVISFIFRFSLYGAGFTLAVFLLIKSPEIIKQAIIDADAYNRFIPSVIETNKKDNSPGTVPFTDPQVQQIFLTSFDSKTIQSGTEGFIDSSYRWLNAEKDHIDFQLDLSANKQQLANNLGAYAVGRASNLPECGPNEKQDDIFRLTCKPENFDLLEERRTLSKQLYEDQNFLVNPILNETTLSGNNQKLSDKYEKYKTYYQWLKIAPFILGFVVLLCTIAIILLNKSLYLGLKQVGFSFFTTGIILAITPIIATYILPKFQNKVQQSLVNSSTESIVNDVNIRLYSELNAILINVSIFVVIAGIVILILSKSTQRKIRYSDVKSGAGLATSIFRKPSQSKNKLSVPVQSSEYGGKTKTRRRTRKYRNIRKNIGL